MFPTNVQYLNLSENKFTSFDSFPLVLEHVETLILDHNQFTSLDHFPYCPNLQILAIRHNHLQSVISFDNIFRQCPNLQVLICQYNQIQIIRGSIPHTLENLDVSFNPIEKCELFFPKHNSQLKELSLDHSKISSLDWMQDVQFNQLG